MPATWPCTKNSSPGQRNHKQKHPKIDLFYIRGISKHRLESLRTLRIDPANLMCKNNESVEKKPSTHRE